jgi:hypothetical protein
MQITAGQFVAHLNIKWVVLSIEHEVATLCLPGKPDAVAYAPVALLQQIH